MSKRARFRVKDLVCATFTPMTEDGEINYSIIDSYADYLVKSHFTGIWIMGSNGESVSLTLDERKRLAETWMVASQGRLEVIVHVGTNCIKEAQELARHAEKIGAPAIAAYSPSYYKPENEEDLVAVMAEIAGAAPNTPFYYYEINYMTGVNVDTPLFCEMALQKIPTFCGLKHSKRDMPSVHACSMLDGVQTLIGTDFQYLSSLVLEVPGVVTNSYLGNIMFSMKAAFDAGDIEKAREIQKTAHLINTIRWKHGRLANVSKAMFKVLAGVEVGPVRLPLRQLTKEQFEALEKDFADAGLAGIAKVEE